MRAQRLRDRGMRAWHLRCRRRSHDHHWHVRLHARRGDAAVEITDLAAELRAHLIVVGRFGVHHRRIGETASRVVELATAPTLVVTLVDQTPDRVPQCAACVAVRAESDGERWFCDEHQTGQNAFGTISLPTTWTGGTLMW